MTAANQRKLVLDVASTCVLLTTGGVRAELTLLDEDDVLAAVLDHTLAPAFDLGLGGRRDLRVLPSALDFYRQTLGSRRRRISERELLEELLRGQKPADQRPGNSEGWLAGEAVRLILNCGSTHLINLIDDGELAQMPGTSYRRGPNGSAQIPVASLKDFLKRRLL